jgi:hypothetical protein
MTKAWIFVSCKSEVIDQIINPLRLFSGVRKVTPVRGVWDFILEVCDSNLNIRVTHGDIKELYGVLSTQILAEI